MPVVLQDPPKHLAIHRSVRQELILHTKLQRPLPASDILPRVRLMDRLNDGRHRLLTLISAPAGYGKSTLASRWMAACEWPKAWVSLEKGDSDLRTFLAYLVAAIRTMFSEVPMDTEVMLEADQLRPAEVSARKLLNDLSRLDEPFLLVLDDFHNIHDSTAMDVMLELLAYPPQHMHLALVTRRDPPLPLATMRGRGQLTEIRAADLRFTPAEAKAFLKDKLKIPVDDATAALLDENVEGWVTGLRLAGLYLHGREDLIQAAKDIRASSRHLLEYLVSEVLAEQDPQIATYLVETSILDRFCAPLCQAVHGSGIKNRKAEEGLCGEEFTERLVEANLFAIPLDNQNYWFRYHHLFQEFLQSNLRKRADANTINGLHMKASNWFAENGLIEEAVKHALNAGNRDAAVSLVIEHRYELLNNGHYHLLNNWLALLPREIVNEAPFLVTTEAINAWVRGQREAVERLTAQAKRLVETLSPESSEYAILQGEIITLHNLICALYNKPPKAWLDPVNALQLLPKKAFFFRILAMAEMAFLHQIKGDLNQGVKLLKEELQTADLPVSIQARGWFYLYVVNYLDCNTSGTLLSGLKSLKLAEEHRLAHTRGLTKYFIGVTYYLRNELTEAKHYTNSAIDDGAFTNPVYVMQARGILSFIYLAEGCPEKAESVIEQEVDSALEMQDSYSPEIQKALQVELALRQGMVDEARRLSIGVDFDILPPTWFYYAPQLTNIKLLLADDTDRSLQDARSRLVEMDRSMCSINRKCMRIDILKILALVYHKMGKQTCALEKLHQALTLAEPDGWVRNFIDLGAPMTKLLERLNHTRPGHAFAKQVLDACRAEARSGLSSRPSGQAPGSMLTQRETEILPLLADGLSDKEIAVKLYVATETVKTHLQNMYRKLNTKGRIEAVNAARALGLITGD